MMKKLSIQFLLLLALVASGNLLGQSLVINHDFEAGTLPTAPGQIQVAPPWSQECTDEYILSVGQGADLFDANVNGTVPSCGVPSNIYGNIIEATSQDRYAHVYSFENGTGPGGSTAFYREAIKGEFLDALEEDCYSLCFLAVSELGPFDIQNWGDQILEVLLASGNGCTGPVIYTTPNIPDEQEWTRFCTTFSISESEAGLYDRIIFRPIDNGDRDTKEVQSIYIDEVILEVDTSTLGVTGQTGICAGQSTTLTATGGYDEYVWSDGTYFFIGESITVSTPGTYTVSASNEDSECIFTMTVVVTALPTPKILLEEAYGVCDGNFPFLCGPSAPVGSTYGYQWFGPDQQGQPTNLQDTTMCFTPTSYGQHMLIVTDQNSGCTATHIFNVFQTTAPVITIPDNYYCEKVPFMLGLSSASTGAVSYSWTIDGFAMPGYNSYQMPFLGDGEYCLTIVWNTGCVSVACFTVEKCCDPDPAFIFEFDVTANPNELTVSNNSANTVNYDYESFYLYRYCGPETDPSQMTWTLIDTMGRSTNFNSPHTFSGSMIQEGCWYRIVHTVETDCSEDSFQSTQYHYVGSLKFRMSPNPVERGQAFTVQLEHQFDGQAEVEVTNTMTGVVELKGFISNDRPFTGQLSPGTQSIYTVRVFNERESVVEQLIVK